MTKPKNVIQGSLFEDDYLVRSLGNIVRDSEYALTELVANAWDAGATEVNIAIPTQLGGLIRVATDEKRRIAEALIEKIVIGDGKIDITFSYLTTSEEQCKSQQQWRATVLGVKRVGVHFLGWL